MPPGLNRPGRAHGFDRERTDEGPRLSPACSSSARPSSFCSSVCWRSGCLFLDRPVTHSALLVVDEIGYLSVTPNGARLFFQLVNARYERASTVLTSNKGFEHLGRDPARRGDGGRPARPAAPPVPHRQHPALPRNPPRTPHETAVAAPSVGRLLYSRSPASRTAQGKQAEPHSSATAASSPTRPRGPAIVALTIASVALGPPNSSLQGPSVPELRVFRSLGLSAPPGLFLSRRQPLLGRGYMLEQGRARQLNPRWEGRGRLSRQRSR